MDLWNVPEFRTGFGFGIVAAAALLAVALAVGVHRRGRPLPLGGVAIVAGSLWSIAENRHVPAAVAVGVLGIGAVAGLSQVRHVSLWYCFALAVPFAWAIGFHGDLVEPVWARLFVTVVASGGSMLVVKFDDIWRKEAPGLTLFVLTAVGVYSAVPDTELAAAVLGASLPLVVLGWPARLTSLGRSGAAAAEALLVWAGAAGGEGRPASIVAAGACLGLLVGMPVGRALLPQLGETFRRASATSRVLALLAAQVVIVLVASRIAGQLSDSFAAAVVAGLTGGAAVLIGASIRPPEPAVAPPRIDWRA